MVGRHKSVRRSWLLLGSGISLFVSMRNFQKENWNPRGFSFSVPCQGATLAVNSCPSSFVTVLACGQRLLLLLPTWPGWQVCPQAGCHCGFALRPHSLAYRDLPYGLLVSPWSRLA